MHGLKRQIKQRKESAMQVLMGMDPDKMIIILPAGLVAIYLIVSVQKYLCERKNQNIGLIIPAACFIAATVLAVRPLIIADANQYEGLVSFCIRMWLTFNIPTIVFLFPYYKRRKTVSQPVQSPADSESAQYTTCTGNDNAESANPDNVDTNM